MEIRDLQNAGSDILDAVSNAVATGNYENLSTSIKRSVSALADAPKTTLSEGMREAMRAGQAQTPANTQAQTLDAPYVFNEHLKGKSAAWTRPDSLRTYSQGATIQKGNKRVSVSMADAVDGDAPAHTPYFSQGFKRFSPYSGAATLALSIVAALATGGFAVVMLVMGLLLHRWIGVGALIGAGLFAAGFVASLYFARKGFLRHRLFDRYKAYGRALSDAEYIAIDDLERLTGIDRQTIVRDIKECQKEGYLPETWFDAQETTLMVSRGAYEQYLTAEKSRLSREEEERALDMSAYSEQVKQIVKDGEDYLSQVRELNRRIPDGEMTRKISRIEDLMGRTFEEVKKQPKAAPSLRKYMSYYLPTTVKLLNAYADLDERPEIGDNITQTKKEISESLDVVGDGFEKLFDSLFEEISWDISSDISVMKTMMAQDGLTEDEIGGAQT